MTKTAEEKEKAIYELDLSKVKAKYLSKKSWWWKLWNDADQVEKDYREFLRLIAVNAGQSFVPWTQDLDDLWHEHILDTRKYNEDCMAIFGEVIHHNPHLPKGTREHRKAADLTTQSRQKLNRPKSPSGSQSSVVNQDYNHINHAGCTTYVPIVMHDSCPPVNHREAVAPCNNHSTPSYDSSPSYSSPSHHDSSPSHSDSSPSSSDSSPSCSSGSSSSCSSSSCSSGSSCGSSCGGGGD